MLTSTFDLMVTDNDMRHLRRCLELAAEAVDAGDEPFGSVLVGGDGDVLAEDRNRETSEGDQTRHPEFALARWAAGHLDATQRAAATVYTSGEHCPMCAAAHGWVGLGRIVYASSSAQTTAWLTDLGVGPSPRTSRRASSRRARSPDSTTRSTSSTAAIAAAAPDGS